VFSVNSIHGIPLFKKNHKRLCHVLSLDTKSSISFLADWALMWNATSDEHYRIRPLCREPVPHNKKRSTHGNHFVVNCRRQRAHGTVLPANNWLTANVCRECGIAHGKCS
jgi:hypothetical protein